VESTSRRRLLRTLFGLLLLGVLIWFAGPGLLLATFRQTEAVPLAGAALLYSVAVLAKCVRWRYIVASQAGKLTFREALRAYGLGMLLAAVTPGRVGQHAKAIAVSRGGMSWERALAGTLLDQLLDLALMASLLPFAAVFYGRSLPLRQGLVVGVVLLLLGGAVVWARRSRFAEQLAELRRIGLTVLAVPALLTVGAVSTYFISVWLIAIAVGMEIGCIPLALASVAAAIVDVVPVTIAGIGTREASLLVLLGPIGIGAPAVIAMTTLTRMLHVAVGALAYGLGSTVVPRADSP